MSERLGVAAPLALLAPPATSTLPSPRPAASDDDGFRALLRDAVERLAEGEATLAAELTQRRAAIASPAELLALQSAVYRHARDVELASRIVDKLTSAVRTVLTSQS